MGWGHGVRPRFNNLRHSCRMQISTHARYYVGTIPAVAWLRVTFAGCVRDLAAGGNNGGALSSPRAQPTEAAARGRFRDRSVPERMHAHKVAFLSPAALAAAGSGVYGALFRRKSTNNVAYARLLWAGKEAVSESPGSPFLRCFVVGPACRSAISTASVIALLCRPGVV